MASLGREEQETIMDMQDDILMVHGDPPGTKADGVTRLLYENANGINNRMAGNAKLDRARDMIHELGADMVALNEHRMNLRHRANVNGFRTLFQGGETEMRALASHNAHINVGKTQEGGTCLLAYGEIIGQYDSEGSGRDASGLGRWTFMTFRGREGFVTRVLCGYNPCFSSTAGLGTVYQQQKNYWRNKGLNVCPRSKFKEDLLTLLTEWRQNGDRIIVCMDANEHIYRKSLGRALTNPEGLGMVEIVGKYTGRELGATYFRGSRPIDAVWATSDLTVVGACVMPCGYGIGDHRLFVVDFLTSSLIGTAPLKIVRPAARRLNTRLPKVAEAYTKELESLIIRHKLIERIGAIHESGRDTKWIQSEMNKVDKESSQYMIGAEARCRKIRAGLIPFSPEAVRWIRRAQVYRSLLQWKAGRRKNMGNLRRLARRVDIARPFQMTETEMKLRLRTCEEKCNALKKSGWAARRKFLREKTVSAQQKEDFKTAEKIIALIKRERDRAFWGKLRFAMGTKRGRSVSMIQVEQADGTLEEHNTQATVEETIFNEIHRKRFFLAEDAPICRGALREAFGYLATTPTAIAILDGSYIYPPDFDEATKALCQACTRIRSIVPKDSVSSIVRRGEWGELWARAKEDTSSSESGLHFGHQKAGTLSTTVTHFHSLKASVVMLNGIVLERWARGLSVMIEKLAGCAMVSKLRSILLMEADENFVYKCIFGKRMLEMVRQYKLMPEEIFSERNRTADDGTLAKTLFYDISRQSRHPAGVASVDADNCFDRIAHAMASLCFQAFGVEASAVETMLGTIEEMKFFLRTAYGDSTSFAGSTIHMKTQGLCQGSGAAPAGWAVVSIVILDAHGAERHGATYCSPISNKVHRMAAILFVDDTDLLHINLETPETLEDTHHALQLSVSSWGTKLMASGGALKPSKCFFYLIDYEWLHNGEWRYRELEDDELQQFEIRVPTPSGTTVAIEYLGVDDARKTLGSMTCPSGYGGAALSRMKEQAQAWIDDAINGSLHRRYIWLLMSIQFWPRVSYGLGCNTAYLKELEDVLQKAYYKILPMGGVIRSAPKALRMLDIGFGGIGCPHPGIECLIAQLNKLSMHYGTPSSVGMALQTSMEFFILELGFTSTSPFSYSYKKYSPLVTHCWLKTLWEKCDKYEIKVVINNIPIQPPREGDKWLNQALLDEGYTVEELQRLNKVQIHQQVLYLSDVLNANGRSVDLKYTTERIGSAWSTYKFPVEQPTEADFTFWNAAVYSLSPAGRPMLRVRDFRLTGHKIWDWRHNADEDQLLFRNPLDGSIDVYRPSVLPGALGRANRWQLVLEAQSIPFRGALCSVKQIAEEVVAIQGSATAAVQVPTPSSFLEVLATSGGQWMWEDLCVTGGGDWVVDAIADSTVRAVTDGSYIEDLFPDVCSAAFILECSEGRGTISGSFTERSASACAYRGEIMGLMAIHLILAGVAKTNPELEGSMDIHCDCVGALGMVKDVPTSRIPSRCKHSDVLKNILVNCNELPFRCKFHHVKAHQDDSVPFHLLDRPSQLNCLMDEKAKAAIRKLHADSIPPQREFPMEPLAIYAGKDKITTESGSFIRFWAHRQLAKSYFAGKQVLDPAAFEQVDWKNYYAVMRSVPRLFQLWACKQTMSIAATNKARSRFTEGLSPLCPSCTTEEETCAHVLKCTERGRVESLNASISLLERWLSESNTEPQLAHVLVQYARSRGTRFMFDLCRGMGPTFARLAQAQDEIGWRRFMEGMVTKHTHTLQHRYWKLQGWRGNADKWMRTLITKLMECTHGQWLYRNVMVHDRWSGTANTLRKEQLLTEIEGQMENGDDLLPEDQYLMEINLGDIEASSGDNHEYWLLAVKAARLAKTLTQGAEGVG